ncbi:TPA: hypothetical protein ACGOY2_001942 [Streptococcus suis]
MHTEEKMLEQLVEVLNEIIIKYIGNDKRRNFRAVKFANPDDIFNHIETRGVDIGTVAIERLTRKWGITLNIKELLGNQIQGELNIDEVKLLSVYPRCWELYENDELKFILIAGEILAYSV